MKKKLLTIIFLIVASITVNSQILQPVKWEFSKKHIDGNNYELIFKAKIDKQWHLYSSNLPEGNISIPTSVQIEKSEFYELDSLLIEVTEPIVVFDKQLGVQTKYFNNNATFKQKIKILTNQALKLTGYVEFMSCDNNQCTPPAEADFDFEFNKEVQEKNQVNTESKVEFKAKSPIDLTHKSLWVFFLISFLAGLAAILTPCVFPMIPMTVSFFMHDNENKRKAKIQALVFGISIIAIYTIIGTLVAVTLGANFANWLSTHWLPNILFFLIFFIFAASFFGMFEITLPSWLVNKSDKKSDKGGFTGAFFMAFTLVLVSFSCTGPIVGAILVASAGGEVLQPIIGMFGFSLAFSLPFTLFAVFPSWLSSLPKSGGWMNSVKVVLGFIELALGLKFLSIADQTYHWGILDREVYIAIWIVIFTLMGLYFLGKIKFSHDSNVSHVTVPRLVMAIITFSFVVYLIPGMLGAPLKALSGYMPPLNTHDFDLHAIIRENSGAYYTEKNKEICEKPKYADFLHLAHGLEGYFDYEQGLACAKQMNKPIFLDFTGHGCVNCREMESNVWSDHRVLKRLREDYIIVALYVDDKTKLQEFDWITSSFDGKIKKTIGKKNADFQISRFQVNAQPYYTLLDTDGNILISPRAYSLDVDGFISFLDRGLSEFKKRHK
ncbi:MAG: thioredoxin family protein [Bacteroidetes bacterium]|nr:thioredoxin family protein [Bacteroidota bacterium]